MDKVTRMNSVTITMEQGFTHLPDKAVWLDDYLHELASFPNGKYDDQADSTSQGLERFKKYCPTSTYWFVELYKREATRIEGEGRGRKWLRSSLKIQ
jgi:hypothetical protein